MILVNGGSNNYNRPAPVFFSEEISLSTKKSRRTPKLLPPPRPSAKSCPVTRIFPTRTNDLLNDKPKPVSFRDDSDTGFITDSPIYSDKKTASYFEQCYAIEERIGCGSFGEVFKVRCKEDGRLYACKRTLLKFRGECDRIERIQEVQKHEQLPAHPNCVHFFRAWEEKQHLHLLTEICQSSLADLSEDKHDLPEYLIWNYIVDLLQGLHHLHKHHFVHMDIKPENIFIGQDDLCKLGDFGLVLDLSKGPVSEALEGDPKYLAPECLNGCFTTAADMFSLGLTVLELAVDLDLPKQGLQWHQLREGNLPAVAAGLSCDLKALLLGLLHPNPLNRLSAEEALNLPVVHRIIIKKKLAILMKSLFSRFCSSMFQLWLLLSSFVYFILKPFSFCKSWRTLDISDIKDTFDKVSGNDLSTYSDDDLDDNSLAHPLTDISSSSTDGHVFHKPFVNSTPISNKLPKPFHFKSSPNKSHHGSTFLESTSQKSSQKSVSSLKLRSNHVSQSGYKSSQKSDLSNLRINNLSMTDDDDCIASWAVTSRNLMDVFNDLESDSD